MAAQSKTIDDEADSFRVRLNKGTPPEPPPLRTKKLDRTKVIHESRPLPLATVKHNSRNPRTHSKHQISQIAASIRQYGFTSSLLVDENNVLIAGHGRKLAAEQLGLVTVPVMVLEGLSEAEKLALLLADNRIPLSGGWDRELLVSELRQLPELLAIEGLDISITGFEPAEIDSLIADFEGNSPDPVDEIGPGLQMGPIVTRTGDIWLLGKHRLMCGDARDSSQLTELMSGRRAKMVFIDPPYNVAIKSIVGRGKTKHAEFAMASGEMSSDQFRDFLRKALGAAKAVSEGGSVHYICMDWKHIQDLLAAGDAIYNELLNVAVWVKSNAGQGSFYRSQHELIAIFRAGTDRHMNNIQLGQHGRTRSNVWHYAGVNSFGRDRMRDLRSHPTVKPISMIVDALKDCTRRNDIVLDTFCGSGTTLLAAERAGRIAHCLELEARYVDVAVHRWQTFPGKDAVHHVTGLTFGETAQKLDEQPIERVRLLKRRDGGSR